MHKHDSDTESATATMDGAAALGSSDTARHIRTA
jgi:hypothetical protein